MHSLTQDDVMYSHKDNNDSILQLPKLSRGVKNNKHKTYQKMNVRFNEHCIKAIETRTISVRVKDVCEAAQISSPTFICIIEVLMQLCLNTKIS